MNNKVVLDASALLALLNQESGGETVENYLANSVMSTVNLSEVISILREIEINQTEAEEIVSGLVSEIIPFNYQQACIAAALRKTTKSHGLSLGDRACFALAKELDLPIVTADKAWEKVKASTKVI